MKYFLCYILGGVVSSYALLYLFKRGVTDVRIM